LFGKVGLDSLQVKQFWRKLEGLGELIVQLLVVLLELLSVLLFKLSESLGILVLGLEEIVVPLLVELVVLLDMSLFALLSLLSLVENELVEFALIILELELGDSVLGHLGLNVLSFLLTSLSVIIENLTVERMRNRDWLLT
jgi:hypothetical protein